jgi:hypothetical protein
VFLTTASATAMKSYLIHYEQAIQRSIQDAQANKTRPIFRYPGFTHRITKQPHRISDRTNLQQHAQHITTTDSQSSHQTPRHHLPAVYHPPTTRGETLIRKHTRWRHLRKSIRTITDYFFPKQPTT